MKRITKGTMTRAVRRLVKAGIAHSWKGAAPYEFVPGIEKELKVARRSLDALLRQLVANQRDTLEETIARVKGEGS